MEELKFRWKVRRKVGANAIKSKIYYSEEAALNDAYEHHGEWWVTAECYYERYGVASGHKIIYQWVNKLHYSEGVIPRNEL